MNGWKTKKEKIIENARLDPFLKIEDLAKRADTTSRYVRTILSEANISLMELRKEYAHSMENINNGIEEKLLLNSLNKVSFSRDKDIKKCSELYFNNPNDLNSLQGNIEKDYFNKSYLYTFKGKPWCINTFFINKDFFTLQEERLSIQDLYLKLVDIIKKNKYHIENLNMEIETATSQISKILGISSLSPIFKVKQVVKKDSEIIALFIVYFNHQRISLSVSFEQGLIINRKGIVV